MHKLRSNAAILRFRLAALLVCANFVLFPASGVLWFYSMITSNLDHTILSLFIFALAVLAVFLQWLLAERTHCPLCITPVLAKKDCAKSKHVRKLFGSHRLFLALSILFRNSFRCPYCNEPTTMQVRERRDQPPYSRS